MTSQELDNLLENCFKSTQREVDPQLIQKARQKLELKQKGKKKRETLLSLLLVVLFHILWVSTLTSMTFILKGFDAAVSICLKNLLISSLLTISACVLIPCCYKMNMEE